MGDWVEAGSRAPDFSLPADDGTKVKLRALRGEPDFFVDALGYYERALERDPLYADAYAAHGRMIWSVYWKMDSPRAPESVDSMRVAAERAIELDPELAEGHLLLGEYFRWHTADYASALASLVGALRPVVP